MSQYVVNGLRSLIERWVLPRLCRVPELRRGNGIGSARPQQEDDKSRQRR